MKITTEDIYVLILFERTRRKLWPSTYRVYFTVYHAANNDLNNLFPNLGRLNIVHKRFTRKSYT